MAVMAMQIKAIGSSSLAMSRTDANNIAMSFLETLAELPFTDVNLGPTDSQISCSADINTNVVMTNGNARKYAATTFKNNLTADSNQWPGQVTSFVQQTAAQAASGTVTDMSGHTYQLSWAVRNCVQTSGETTSKVITVFMTWGPTIGQSHLQMTTIKFNNT